MSAVAAIECRGVTKTYGQVQALAGVDFDVHLGEVVALIGDNGAGKSTLIKVLSGVVQPDSGQILSDGAPVSIHSPTRAREVGIETVYQDLALAPHLTPVHNMFLGREILRPGLLGRLGFMDGAEMRRRAVTAFAGLGATVRDFDGVVETMSGGQRQQIAVARAASWANRVIILDEPTAALGVVQTRNVLDLVRRVRDRGIGVIFVSHNMPQVLDVADRIQVMRLGERVATFRASQATTEELIGAMTGASSRQGSAAADREPA